MAGTTKVTVAMLNSAAQVATQAGEDITANLARLLGEVEQQQASFQGQAGTSFQNVSSDLGAELRKLLSALNQMADSVNQSGTVFGSTDADASSEIGKIAGNYIPGGGSVANALRG